MSIISYSTLANGQQLAFDPLADVLYFDDFSLIAASLSLAVDSGNMVTSLSLGGKKIIFSAPFPVAQISLEHFVFAGGSGLVVGDGATETSVDASANLLVGETQADSLFGLGGADRLLAGAGNDVLNGGAGADTMEGAAGSDRYVVDNTGDVVVEAIKFEIVRVSPNPVNDEGYDHRYDNASLSSDGRYVAFASNFDNIAAGDLYATHDVYFKDMLTGETARTDTARGGETAINGSFAENPRYLVFESRNDDIVAGDDGYNDIFVADLVDGSFVGVSTGGNNWSSNASLSADGRFVVFESNADNLVPGDSNGITGDIFVKNLATKEIQRIGGDRTSELASISANGRYVVFQSDATNLVAGDTNGWNDVFIKDLQTGVIRVVSCSATGQLATYGADLTWSNGNPMSADGRYVVFESDARNLMLNTANGYADIYLKDMDTGTVRRVSTTAEGYEANGRSWDGSLSADGRYAVFTSNATNLVAGDTNNQSDIFVKDLVSGAIQRVSVSASGVQANDTCYDAAFSADGRYIVFGTDADNLVAGDTGGTADIFRVTNPLWRDAGVDTVEASVNYVLPEQVEQLRLTGTGAINGAGNGLNNLLVGNAGNNILTGAGGADTMQGGAGNDTYVVDSSSDRAAEGSSAGGVDLVKSSVSWTLGSNVENLLLTGTAAVDGAGNGLANRITGNGAANILTGGGGNDTISGGGGNDKINGGAGNDSLLGGAGNDAFLFSTALAGNVDTLADFAKAAGNSDRIQLDDDVFTRLGGVTTSTQLRAAAFYAGPAAHDGDDRIIYAQSSGALYYDADGNGPGAAVKFAVIGAGTHPALAAGDFWVVP